MGGGSYVGRWRSRGGLPVRVGGGDLGKQRDKIICNSIHVVLANWFSFLPLGPFAPITWFCSYFLHVIVEVINISHIASHDIKHTIHT
jgi:hypothetical protein